MAKKLERRLAREHYHSVFLDLDPEKGIAAGRSWERTLYRKLRSCRAVVALCTNHYLRSHWCFAEIALARMEGKHIIAILAEPLDDHTKMPVILTEKQFIDLRHNEEEGYLRLWRSLRELDLVGDDWNPKNPPYLGLSAYQEEHAPVFFGREDESRAGVELLERGAPGLIMVLGASGSGKSSLVRAGILPRLRRQPDHWLVVDPFRPGHDPFSELAESLAQTYRRYAPDYAAEAGDRKRIRERLESWANSFSQPTPRIETQREFGESQSLGEDDRLQRLIEQLEGLRRDPPPLVVDQLRDFLDWSLEDLRRICGTHFGKTDASEVMTSEATPLVHIAHHLRRDSGWRNARVVLVIDQFEELLGRKDIDDHANRFLALLRASIEVDHRPLISLGTMRSDFLGLFQQNAAMHGIDFESLSLAPMQIDGMRRVIEQPARLGAIELEDSLADRLLEDTETADALPLLSFTLSVLWREHRNDGKLTIRSYKELGGVQGAVASEADAILAMAKRQGKEDDLRRALLQMARLSEDGTYARQPVSWNNAAIRQVEPILDKFVERRLLVVREEGDSKVVEVAHEALFRSWEPLRMWLEYARSELLLKQQLRRDAVAWEENGHPADSLWRGGRLLQAKELMGNSSLNGLPSREMAFVNAGLRRRQRQRLTLVGTTLAVIAFLLGFLLYALEQADRARKERSRALDLARVSMAGEQLDRDPTTASLILTEIEDPENTPFAKRRLSEVLRLPLIYAELKHESPATHASFSPDGNVVVTVTEDNNVRVWDVKTGAPLTELLRHDTTVTTVLVSPDGTVVLTTAGNSVWLWNVASGEKRFAEPWHHDGPVNTVSFSPNGKLVLTTAGNSVWLWNVASGEKRFAEPWRHDGPVNTASFSPNGKLVATGCDDGNVRVWDVETGEARSTEPWKHNAKVNMVLFSPDGKLVLTGADNRVVRVWDVETGEEKANFQGDARLAQFSPNGNFVVTTQWDSVHVWNVPDGRKELPSLVHTPSPMIAAWFSPNEDLLLTVSGHRSFGYWDPRADNMLRAWDLKTGELRFAKQLRHGSEIMDAAFSPNGRLLATRSGTRHGSGRGEHLRTENTVRVWTLETEGERFSLSLPGGVAAFSPDGMLVVTASDNMAQLWNMETGRTQLQEPLVIDQPVSSVAFSPDGKLVLTASLKTAQLWDVTTGRQHFAEPLSFPELLEVVGSSSVSFSANGQYLITEHLNNTVQVWDIRTGDKRFPEPPKYCGAPVRPAVSPDGKLLVSACGQTVQLWDVDTGRERFPESWSHDSGYVRSVEFSPDGKRVLTASDDRTARIWDVETGKELHTLQPDPSSFALYGMGNTSFSPDGKLILATSDGHIAWIWDVETGNELHKLEHPGRVENAAFNADGRFVVTIHTGDNSISRLWVWDTETGAMLSEIPMRSENWSLGPFGEYLVTWQEESARVWHLETGDSLFSEPLSHPKLQKMASWMSTGHVRIASFSPDGRRLLTTTDDETRVWMISGELLQSAVRSATFVCLSPSFRQQVLGEPYDEARTKYEACERSHGRTPELTQAPGIETAE